MPALKQITDTLVAVSVESTGVDGVTVWNPMNQSPGVSSLPIGSMSTDVFHGLNSFPI